MVDWLKHNLHFVIFLYILFLTKAHQYDNMNLYESVLLSLDVSPPLFHPPQKLASRHCSSPQCGGKRRYRLRHAKHPPVAWVAPVHRPTRTRTPPVGFGDIDRLEWKIKLLVTSWDATFIGILGNVNGSFGSFSIWGRSWRISLFNSGFLGGDVTL